LIGEEREVELMFVAELLVALHRIDGDAEDDGVGFGDVRFVIAKVARLGRAARRVVLRIEVQDHVLAAELLERHFFPARRREPEIGSRVADFRFVEILH